MMTISVAAFDSVVFTSKRTRIAPTSRINCMCHDGNVMRCIPWKATIGILAVHRCHCAVEHDLPAPDDAVHGSSVGMMSHSGAPQPLL